MDKKGLGLQIVAMQNVEELVKRQELFDNKYVLIRPLSKDGATADVWLALDIETVSEDVREQITNKTLIIASLNDEQIGELGLMVAFKIYRPMNALDVEGWQRFKDEFVIVYGLDHENLVKPSYFHNYGETPYLVLPYCRRGSSERLISEQQGEEAVWTFVEDVAAGLAHLHAQSPPIIHQDIKPANILLKDNNRYAITDFGISSQRDGVHSYYGDEDNSGTMAYMAPERFADNAMPMPESDVWAFGATLCEILSGQVPFGEYGGKAQAQQNLPMPPLKQVSSSLRRLVYACLAENPGQRPSAAQIALAAKLRQFPVKNSNRATLITLLLTLIVLAGGIAYFFLQPKSVPLSKEELYTKALVRLGNIFDADSVMAGHQLMDSLAKADYLPAICQMALTYGWYDNDSVKTRKRLLGIKYDDRGTPRDMAVRTRALALFQRITSQADSTLSRETADAYFRQMIWHVEQAKIADERHRIEEISVALVCCDSAVLWAGKARDTLSLRQYEQNREIFKNYLQRITK